MMMKKKTLAFLLLGAFGLSIQAQWEAHVLRNDIRFTAESENIEVMRNFEEPLDPKKEELYLLAEEILREDKQGNFHTLSKDARFQALCKKYNKKHLGGPMLGDASQEGVKVWLRTLQPAAVEVKVEVDGKWKSFGPVQANKASDLSAVVAVDGLQPGTKYNYTVWIDGKELELDTETYFQTVPASEDSKTRIAFGSCYHRLGLSNMDLSQSVVARKPHGMLLLGDIAVQGRMNYMGRRTLDYLMRDMFDAWQYQVSKVPVYATWDDHDFIYNDEYGKPDRYTHKDVHNIWEEFTHAWNNPSYGLGEGQGEGLFHHTRIHAVDVIMLDNRYFRAEGNFLGDEQMAWLKKQLLNSEAPFIILSSGTMWSDYLSDGKDSWGVFDPEGREELFAFIEENNIGGVLLISGDRHGARGFRIPRESGFELYEFGAASLGWLFGPPVSMPEWTTQFYGTSAVAAFGEFTFNTSVSDPTVTFRLVDENQDVLHEMTLTRSQLTPANYRE